MEPVIELDGVRVFHGDCVEVLKTLPDNSIDAVVTDPPYGLEFMGKEWDSFKAKKDAEKPGKQSGQTKFWSSNESSGIGVGGPRFSTQTRSDMIGFEQFCVEWAIECLRVLKPGGHLLAFGGTRTWHRLAVAVEDAGFEVRDSIAWMYGSGFPKSLNVSKAIEKRAGVGPVGAVENEGGGFYGENSGWNPTPRKLIMPETQTAEGKQWQGWGTALKPAFEPIVVARKPLSGTVAETVLEWGTGGLNIDGSRVNVGENDKNGFRSGTYTSQNHSRTSWTPNKNGNAYTKPQHPQGRWPANVILDEVTAGLLDEQSGVSKSPPVGSMTNTKPRHSGSMSGGFRHENPMSNGHGDSGGASRFFYCAKASKRDRNEGLEDLEAQRHADRVTDDGVGGDNPRNRTNQAKQNFHPTVKPTALMRYLVKLVTPPGGTVLDPFTGSGSTGKAAILEGFDFVGVELTDDYLPIIEGRLKWALDNQDEGTLF